MAAVVAVFGVNCIENWSSALLSVPDQLERTVNAFAIPAGDDGIRTDELQTRRDDLDLRGSTLATSRAYVEAAPCFCDGEHEAQTS